MSIIRVLLADDHPPLRAGIRSRLEQEEDIQIAGETGSGIEALELVDTLKPHLLLLDMQLPDLSGIDVARRLHAAESAVRILILSAYHTQTYISALRDCGVSGYLTKQEPLETIVKAVRGVARGETGWISREVAAVLMSRVSGDPMSGPTELLSRRQREVLRLIAEGCSNVQIGERLFISESTVKKHISSVFQKLGLASRAEAAAWAWEHGLLNS